MGPEVFVPIAAFIMITTIVTSVLRYRERSRGQQLGISPIGGEISNRLERIEQAIEAIAVEVERISEGQRFTTRLLSERADRPSQGEGARHLQGGG